MAYNYSYSTKIFHFLLLISAIPIALIFSLERRAHPRPDGSGGAYIYHSSGWIRESATWDDLNRRFIVSFMEGGVGQIRVPEDHDDRSGTVLEEIAAVKDADLAGNASLGISVDRPRNRVMVAVADVIWNRYSALAAYDLTSWERLFLTQLSGPDDKKTFANDVTTDNNGNTYVTDTKGSKIWKLSVNGDLLSTITSPLFLPKQWYNNLIGLNGIVYHPDGFLLVIHTITGNLCKIDNLDGKQEIVKSVKLVGGGSLRFGDGMELVSATRLVVAATYPSARLVESTDGWETAKVVGQFVGPTHRVATAVAVKDGGVFVSYLMGLGFPQKKHVFVEAVF